MPRQMLSDPRSEGSESSFFPAFQKEMNRLFDQFRHGALAPLTNGATPLGEAVFPAVDVIDMGDALEVTAEIPGVKEDELDVTISGDVLVLKGVKSAEHEENEDTYHLIERRYGAFRRQIPLGFTPEDGAVDATFSNGILTLRIEKPEQAKSGVQKIAIKTT